MPIISIIVPVYNTEQYLHRCIDSILAQTYTDFELLLIDDGSTDLSGAICDEYAAKDSRVRVFHKENGGASTARNKGIKESRGEWIIFLDSDDYFLPKALDILIGAANKYCVPISHANFYTEDVERKVVCNRWKNGIVSNNFRAWYFHSICLCAGTTLYKRSIMNNSLYNEEFSRYEDLEAIFKLLRQHKLAYTNECVMVYDIKERGLSAKCKDWNKDYIFHMDFKNKSFWEKMELGTKLNEGYGLYHECSEELDKRYKGYKIYAWLDCKIRRFKRWKDHIYQFYNKVLRHENIPNV